METDYHTFTTIDTTQKERKRLGVGDVWLNRVKCNKCGDIIQSNNRHDFKWCKCKSIAVDGGSWYLKRVGNIDCCKDMSVTYNDVKNETD